MKMKNTTEKEEPGEIQEGLENTTIKSRYDHLTFEREHYIDRARDNAELTIPYLMPPDGFTTTSKLNNPYQSIGARGVNNLASKMVLAFLPPNQSVFSFTVSESVLKDIENQNQNQEQVLTIGVIEKSLRSLERDILKEISASNIRMSLFEAFKHLYVVGNILIYAPQETNNVKLFRLDRYVCVRDSLGNPIEIITEEELSPMTIDEDILEYCGVESDDYESDVEKKISIYTRVVYNDDIKKYEVIQELNGKVVPDSYGTFPKDKLPWICLRGIAVDGENYGRSYVEEYYGDLNSLERLQQNIVEATAGISKTLWMVNPNGTTRKKDIAEAPNNAIVTGNANDVSVLRSDKQADLSIAQQTIMKIEERLGYAFMLNTSIQRNGDRVTAEEIRYMAKELEDGLGGMFTTLTNELMLPLLNIILDRMTKQKKIPQFPKGLVKPQLTTGLESIGRTNDLNNLQIFVQALGQINAMNYINIDEVVKRIGNSLNINMDGLVKTKEEIQVEQQKAQEMAMMQSLGPNAINQIGGIAKEEIAQQGEM